MGITLNCNNTFHLQVHIEIIYSLVLCFALINLSSSCKCFISIIRDGACCSRKEKSGANVVRGAPSVKTSAGKMLAETEKSFATKTFSFNIAKIFVFQISFENKNNVF